MTKMAEQIDNYEKTIQEFRKQMQASGTVQKDKKRTVATGPSISSSDSERDTRRVPTQRNRDPARTRPPTPPTTMEGTNKEDEVPRTALMAMQT